MDLSSLRKPLLGAAMAVAALSASPAWAIPISVAFNRRLNCQYGRRHDRDYHHVGRAGHRHYHSPKQHSTGRWYDYCDNLADAGYAGFNFHEVVHDSLGHLPGEPDGYSGHARTELTRHYGYWHDQSDLGHGV